jgi:hypothetical protein
MEKWKCTSFVDLGNYETLGEILCDSEGSDCQEWHIQMISIMIKSSRRSSTLMPE